MKWSQVYMLVAAILFSRGLDNSNAWGAALIAFAIAWMCIRDEKKEEMR